MKELFLDANAHIAMGSEACKAYTDFQNSKAGAGHPLAPAGPGREAATALETARGKIANLLGAESPSNIVFTSTCTQACEWGLTILNSHLNKFDGMVTYSPMEHSAVRSVVEGDLFEDNIVKKFSVSKDGVIDIGGRTSYAVCTHVQNELGTIQPIEKLNTGFLFADMCQSVGKVSICLRDMPVDIAVFGAHKFGGPAGVGFMYLKDPMLWKEFGSGSRYFNDRPGTPDVASVVATAAALEETLFNMPERLEKMKEFQTNLESNLESMGLDIIGKGANRVANTSFVKIQGLAFNVLAELTQKGIHVGMGSACGSMHSGSSLIMMALGMEGDAHDFIRISQHGDYGKSEAEYVSSEIEKLLNIYRK